MEFTQLPGFVQSADVAYDRFIQSVRSIRAEIADTIDILPEVLANCDILGTIETVTLNVIWCAAWAVGFAFYMTRAAVKAWHDRSVATPDEELPLPASDRQPKPSINRSSLNDSVPTQSPRSQSRNRRSVARSARACRR
jgi:hypothetical protein